MTLPELEWGCHVEQAVQRERACICGLRLEGSEMKKLSKGFYLSAVAISVIGSIVFLVGYAPLYYRMISAMIASNNSGTEWTSLGPRTFLFAAIGDILSLYGGIALLVLIYQMWQSIQDGHARTTPGKAVGFLFIPFFNLYWMFQAVW